MNQTALNRAVARATGESVDTIARLGFSLVAAPRYPGRAPASPCRWRPARRRKPSSRPAPVPVAN
jgi:hypothetical protein